MNLFEENLIEFIAVITSLLYVFYAGKNKLICWLFAIVSSSIYVYINAISHLYFFTILQFFYVIVAFYGWAMWKKSDNQLKLRTLGWKNIPIIILGTLLSVSLGYYVDKHFVQTLPYVDALNFVFCLIASFMISLKIIESWIYLIVFDLVASYIYYFIDLYQSAILYLILALFGVYAFVEWGKQYRRNNIHV